MSDPKINYMIAAGNVIQDANTRKWSYIDIFNTVKILKGQDVSYQSFFVAGRINNVASGDAKDYVEITDPDNKQFAKVELTGRFDEGDAYFVALFPLMQFKIVGRYYFHFRHEGKLIPDGKEYYIDITKDE